jgi:hypothetical protein
MTDIDTDDERRDYLRKLTAAIFGRDPDPDETARERLATATTGPRNVVPDEGTNPGGEPIDGRAYAIEFVRDLFNKPEAFYEQRLPEQETT